MLMKKQPAAEPESPAANLTEAETRMRQHLLALVAGTTETLKSLSLRVGRNAWYLRDFVHRGHPRQLHERDRKKLAELLQVPDEELRVERYEKIPPYPLTVAPRDVGSSRSRPIMSEQRDLPILGHAKGGEEGYFFTNGDIAGYTMRPSVLMGVDDAYAVEMWDNSMYPAIKHGHLCWVHPRKAIHPEDDVVVEMKDGQALIKNLVRRTAKETTVQQYNPPRQIKIPAEKIKAVHLIVGGLRVRS